MAEKKGIRGELKQMPCEFTRPDCPYECGLYCRREAGEVPYMVVEQLPLPEMLQHRLNPDWTAHGKQLKYKGEHHGDMVDEVACSMVAAILNSHEPHDRMEPFA